MTDTAAPTDRPAASVVPHSAADLDRHLTAFAALLRDCVRDGASVGFVWPLSLEDATAFWRDTVHPRVAAGRHLLWGAWADGRLVGTVQLEVDMPPNQPHRGAVTKLLVHPDARRQGLGRRLMTTLETAAVRHGRTLLTLDTRVGDPSAALYTQLGFVPVGEIPGWSLDPHDPDKVDPTLFMYKPLP